jgi:crotonobetainyl-CoA:carnitine CoA-transferase CaiB-like acyl-CoA transferase
MADQGRARVSGALSGFRVIEAGHIISGPFCGHLFADHGAEVIKVETPRVGDAMRSWGGLYRGVGLYWPIIARGKKSVTLDLRDADGQAALRELASTADVIIENFRPGTFERWNLGPARLHEINPDLVIVRITGYGQDGPYRDRAGFGAVAEAMSGFRYLSGEPRRPPVRVGISIADSLAGTQGFTGALLALLAAQNRPGVARGQVVDVALYEAMWMYMESLLPEYEKLGRVREPSGATLPGIAPSNVYPTKDGQWILIAANQDTVFRRLAAAFGREDWTAAGSSYTSHTGRGERQAELDASVAEHTSTVDARDLLALLESNGVPCGLIYTAADIAVDAHFEARDMLIRVPEPGLYGEQVPMPGVVPKLSVTPGQITRGGPLLGEHNDEIWPALLGSQELERLRSRGLI